MTRRELLAAAATDAIRDLTTRSIATFRRTELWWFRSFVTSCKWLFAVFTGVNGVSVVASFALPRIPTFTRAEAWADAMDALAEGYSAMLTFEYFPFRPLTFFEAVLRTKSRLFVIPLSSFNCRSAPLAAWFHSAPLRGK